MKNSPDKSSDERLSYRNRMAIALIFGALIHAPLFLQEQIENIDETAYIFKEKVKKLIFGYGRAEAKIDYISELKEKLERGEEIDFGEFYSVTEFNEGIIDADTLEKLQKEIEEEVKKLKELTDKTDVLTVLSQIVNAQGEYEESNTYLSDVILNKYGNCKARQKRASVLVQRVYPDMPMKFQRMKLGGTMHIRLLVQVDDDWYSVESPGPQLVTGDDMAGTVINESDDYFESYVGESPDGEFVLGEGDITKSKTNDSETDDYLVLSLPVSPDEIRDFNPSGETNPNQNTGTAIATNLARLGMGSSSDTVARPAFGGAYGESKPMDPIEIDVISFDPKKILKESEGNPGRHKFYSNVFKLMREARQKMKTSSGKDAKINTFCSLVNRIDEEGEMHAEDSPDGDDDMISTPNFFNFAEYYNPIFLNELIISSGENFTMDICEEIEDKKLIAVANKTEIEKRVSRISMSGTSVKLRKPPLCIEAEKLSAIGMGELELQIKDSLLTGNELQNPPANKSIEHHLFCLLDESDGGDAFLIGINAEGEVVAYSD